MCSSVHKASRGDHQGHSHPRACAALQQVHGRVGLCDALHVGLLQCLVKDKEKSGPVRHYISNTSWTLCNS